ncbi:hypothetical protein LIER_34679 [Lithospermum erythrorhizon]|uniref:Uncharacterized protein n=1 Tax=Lithospermum erythrorhizon TaxID=34254 RepID=A0AAV3S4E1_LITER
MWFTHNDFTNLVEEYWATSNGAFSENVQSFAHKETVWNKEVYGNVHLKLRRICARIKGVRTKMVESPSTSLSLLESKLLSEYDELLTAEKLLWFVKSRTQWLQFEDASTRYFHTCIIILRQKKHQHHTRCVWRLAH